MLHSLFEIQYYPERLLSGLTHFLSFRQIFAVVVQLTTVNAYEPTIDLSPSRFSFHT